MLPLCARYVRKYGLDTEAVMENQLGLLQMLMAQHAQQPHPPKVALDQHAQQ